MAYGPLAQCAFMSGPSQFRKKAPPKEQGRETRFDLPLWKPPDRCEAPPPGAFALYAFEVEEAKNDPKYTSRQLSLDETRSLILGSSQDLDGQVYDGHKGVHEQHAAIFYQKGKWFLKAINGMTILESMTLHPYLRDSEGKPPKRYTSTGPRKLETVEPMDPKKRITREMCIVRLADSDRRFWISGPLPLGDGEVEETAGGEARERKKDKKDKEKDKDRDKEKDRRDTERHDRSRTRSRSRKRRK